MLKCSLKALNITHGLPFYLVDHEGTLIRILLSNVRRFHLWVKNVVFGKNEKWQKRIINNNSIFLLKLVSEVLLFVVCKRHAY